MRITFEALTQEEQEEITNLSKIVAAHREGGTKPNKEIHDALLADLYKIQDKIRERTGDDEFLIFNTGKIGIQLERDLLVLDPEYQESEGQELPKSLTERFVNAALREHKKGGKN